MSKTIVNPNKVGGGAYQFDVTTIPTIRESFSSDEDLMNFLNELVDVYLNKDNDLVYYPRLLSTEDGSFVNLMVYNVETTGGITIDFTIRVINHYNNNLVYNYVLLSIQHQNTIESIVVNVVENKHYIITMSEQ